MLAVRRRPPLTVATAKPARHRSDRDTDHDWLVWHVHRDTKDQYYLPLEVKGDFRLEARVKATSWNGNCSLYFGLVENMGYVWPTTATGAFVEFGYSGGSGLSIAQWINFEDGTPDSGRVAEDASTFIRYNLDTWYRIVFVVAHGRWSIAAYLDSGQRVGYVEGVMPSSHSGYHYVMLANQDDNEWPTGDGFFDDLYVGPAE